MSEREKLILETKKEIRSILLSTKSGVEFTRLNREYEMFTGSKINYRGMGYTSLRAFVDDIPDVARQFDDGYGTITLLGVADETTRHIASLVSRQRGKKKTFRGRHSFPGPRLGLLSNLPLPRSSYASRSFAESHSNPHAWRYTRTISRTNPAASPVAGKLRTSVSDQKSAVVTHPVRQPSKDICRETVVPALKTMDPGVKPVVPGLRTVVPEFQMGVVQSKTFKTNLKQMLSKFVERISSGMIYSSFKKSFEKEFGVKLDLAEFGYSSISEMFSSLGIPVRVKKYSVDDYTILPGPIAAASDMDKGEQCQSYLASYSVPVFSVERPAAAAAQSSVPSISESYHLPSSYPAPQPYPAPQHSVHSLEVAPLIHSASMTSRPSSRRMSLVSHSSRTAPVSDKPRMPSTPSVSQELRNAISQVLKNSPDGILIGDLEAKLKEMTGVKIDIEATGARSLEHLLVNVPEIVLMHYQGHGQLLLFDPGQTTIKDKIDPRQNFERKDTRPPDVDCSGRGQERQGMGQMHESRSKYQPREIPEDAVGPEQVIGTQQLTVAANEYLPIYVSNVVTPGHFWFQIDGEQYGRLVDLMEMLQSTYNHPRGCLYEMPSSFMKIGQLCAAKFAEDSNWHRGTIMGFKDSLVQIYYLDYGTTSFVTKDQLRILRSRYLTLPAQAIRARLANVQPANGEWSEAAYTFFMKHFINKRLMALITNNTRDGLVSVCLTDTNGEEDIHVNDCLVMEGFATMQVDDYEPEVSVSKKAVQSTSFSKSKAVEVKPSRTGDEDEVILISEQDIKFVQLPPNYGCHMVRISDKLYIISNEISAFIWEENVLRTMIRQKGYAYLPKLVLTIKDHLAVMEELAKFNIPGVFVDGVFADILVLYELSIVIQILEIFEHKSEQLKSELKKHLDIFSANPSKWTVSLSYCGFKVSGGLQYVTQGWWITACAVQSIFRGLSIILIHFFSRPDFKASTVPCVGDEDCVNIMSDDLAIRSGPSRCDTEASKSEDAKEGKELRKEWKVIAEQRKKLLHQMRNSASPKTSAYTVEELSRMESQMKVLEDRYDTIQKRLREALKQESGGITDANFNAKMNKCLVTASIADAKAEKIQGLAVTQSPTMQKKPRTNAVAPMTQADAAPATADVHRDCVAPGSRPTTGHPSSASLQSDVRQPAIGFAPTVRPGMEYGQQMNNLAQMLSQMTIRNQAPLSGPMGMLGLAGIGYPLPNPQLHTPFGYSAAQILMQQQSYLAALQGLSSLVSSGSSYPQTPYDSSLLGITNLSYLAHAAPSGSAMPRTTQPGPQQN